MRKWNKYIYLLFILCCQENILWTQTNFIFYEMDEIDYSIFETSRSFQKKNIYSECKTPIYTHMSSIFKPTQRACKILVRHIFFL